MVRILSSWQCCSCSFAMTGSWRLLGAMGDCKLRSVCVTRPNTQTDHALQAGNYL